MNGEPANASGSNASGSTASGSTASILLLSGPNLNLLGHREPEIYGSATLDDLVEVATRRANESDVRVDHIQSNHEGVLVDHIQEARSSYDAIIINPGAFTHYAWSIHDALAAFDGIIIELHISNPNAREPWRHVSVVAPVATGSIVGFGGDGYRIAVDAAVSALTARRT